MLSKDNEKREVEEKPEARVEEIGTSGTRESENQIEEDLLPPTRTRERNEK
jgi:hypothetical protein